MKIYFLIWMFNDCVINILILFIDYWYIKYKCLIFIWIQVCTIPIEKVVAAKFEVLAEKICAPSHKVRDWIHALPLNNRTPSSSELIS